MSQPNHGATDSLCAQSPTRWTAPLNRYPGADLDQERGSRLKYGS
jgi:hypothetical protein